MSQEINSQFKEGYNVSFEQDILSQEKTSEINPQNVIEKSTWTILYKATLLHVSTLTTCSWMQHESNTPISRLVKSRQQDPACDINANIPSSHK